MKTEYIFTLILISAVVYIVYSVLTTFINTIFTPIIHGVL